MQLRATRTRLIGGGIRSLVDIIKGLFSNNEQGVWYDPSDMSTLYQDAAGTIPVTAVEQPVGLMLDKSKGLVLGAELASIGSQYVQNGSGTQTSGVWSVTASGTFAGVRQTTVFNAGSLYRITGSWSGNTNGRAIIINFGGAGGVASLGTAASGTINGYYFAGTNPINIQTYASNSVAGDTFSFSLTSIRELPGNHASQITATSRPVLSARVNLLTKTEDFADAVWTKTNVNPSSSDTLLEIATTGNHRVQQLFTAPATKYTYCAEFKPAGRTTAALQIYDGVAGTTKALTIFSLVGNGSAVLNSSGTYSITLTADGWYRCAVEMTADLAAGSGNLYAWVVLTDGANQSYLGDATKGVRVRKADLRPANTVTNLPDYQRVNTATDYDTAGFPRIERFDAVDDVQNITFPVSLGSNCTVARVAQGGAVTILTGQTIGTSYQINQSHAGLIVVNRALTQSETNAVTRYFQNKGSGK